MKNITLNVVMLDTHRTYMAITHENDHVPYGRRIVRIELPANIIDMLKRRIVGQIGRENRYEEIGPVWLEEENEE